METKNTHLIYGLFTAIASIILGIVLHISGLGYEKWAQYLVFAVLLIGLILNAIAFSKANDANVTYGQVFSSCFKATAIFTLISIVATLVTLYAIPEMKERTLQMAEDNMIKQGASEEQIEKALELTRNNYNVFVVGGTMFWDLLLGAIFSAIAAAIAKKNPNAAPPAQMQ